MKPLRPTYAALQSRGDGGQYTDTMTRVAIISVRPSDADQGTLGFTVHSSVTTYLRHETR